MVRILANGDIVQDDDPRIRNTNQRTNYEGNVREGVRRTEPADADAGMVQGPNVFDTWNQKLLQLGIPRWNIGDHVVEPIMTVLVLITLLLFGFQGLLFLGLLYFVVKLSQRSSNQSSSNANENRRPTGFGGGRRLGR